MYNPRNYAVRIFFIQQINPRSCWGRSHIDRLLYHYVENDQRPDYYAYIRLVAEEFGIKPESVKASIRKFVRKGWYEYGRDWEWHRLLYWKEDTPPPIDLALPSICKSYMIFCLSAQTYCDWAHRRVPRLREIIEEYERLNPIPEEYIAKYGLPYGSSQERTEEPAPEDTTPEEHAEEPTPEEAATVETAP